MFGLSAPCMQPPMHVRDEAQRDGADGSARFVVSCQMTELETVGACRMEAGDHWVVYATVDSGKVTEEGALSTVHHRKVGTTY